MLFKDTVYICHIKFHNIYVLLIHIFMLLNIYMSYNPLHTIKFIPEIDMLFLC